MSQFTSPVWKRTLTNLQISLKFSLIRSPQSNLSDGVMCEVGKYFHEQYYGMGRVYPLIKRLLNITVAGSTVYTPVELMFAVPRPDIFTEIFSKTSDQTPSKLRQEDKLFRTFATMKTKALERQRKRKAGLTKWE